MKFFSVSWKGYLFRLFPSIWVIFWARTFLSRENRTGSVAKWRSLELAVGKNTNRPDNISKGRKCEWTHDKFVLKLSVAMKVVVALGLHQIFWMPSDRRERMRWSEANLFSSWAFESESVCSPVHKLRHRKSWLGLFPKGLPTCLLYFRRIRMFTRRFTAFPSTCCFFELGFHRVFRPEIGS